MQSSLESGRRDIPSLDGLRALSISLVIVAHMADLLGIEHGIAARFLNVGTLGVRVFFVISGFLITTLLVKELERGGRIHLGRFYFRRVLRIFPAYYGYLAIVALLGALGLLSTVGIHWLPAVTYTSNLLPEPWLVGHGWSLSVEEQFYICWPACLLILGRRRALRVAIGVVVLSPFLRVLAFALTRSNAVAEMPCFDTIAAGCIMALLWPAVQRDERVLRVLRWRAFALIPVSTLAVYWIFAHQVRWLFVADLLVGQTCVAAGLALTVAWCILNAESVVGRVLNLGPLRALGVLSYSLYLWQQVFTSRDVGFPPVAAPLAALIAAIASYYLLERPGLLLRERLAGRLRLLPGRDARDSMAVGEATA